MTKIPVPADEDYEDAVLAVYHADPLVSVDDLAKRYDISRAQVLSILEDNGEMCRRCGLLWRRCILYPDTPREHRMEYDAETRLCELCIEEVGQQLPMAGRPGVEELGPRAVVVYGAVRRCPQVDGGKYRVNVDAMARRVDMARSTIRRWLKRLCEEGYLRDLTPDASNQPHVYAIRERKED